MRDVLVGLFAVLGMAAYSDQSSVSVVATPNPVLRGGSTDVMTKILLVRPSGTTELTATETLSPTSDVNYVASVGAEQANLRIIVDEPPFTSNASWQTPICHTTGFGGGAISNCSTALIDARGFQWKITFDPINGVFVAYMASSPDVSIYSSDVFEISARTRQIVRVVNGLNENSPDACTPTQNPPLGHMIGFQWFDTVLRSVLMTLPLCGGLNAHNTSVYDVTTHAMQPLRPSWPATAPSVGFDSGAVYVPSYGKAILCCGDNPSSSVRVIEYDSAADVYTDISTDTKGVDGVSCDFNKTAPNPVSLHCPILRYGSSVMTDQGIVWIFGGQQGSGPTTELFSYNPTTRVFTKAATTVPPVTQGAMPLAFIDSNRHRIVYVSDPNTLWFYGISSGAWTSQAAPNGPEYIWGGSACDYDPVLDAGLCVVSHGQGASPDIRVVSFQ